jgi:hypothetical protein
MLSARKTMCLLLVCLCSYASIFAQQTTTKPKIFGHLPATIAISENLLQSFFSLTQNEETTLYFGSHFTFPCRVLSNQVRYANLRTVIVRSHIFGNAILQVSRITNDDLTTYYEGRIINENAFDGFVIKKVDGGTYQLQKFETGQVLDECKL